MNWPNDADGDVFRRLEEKNFDFDSTVQVDFNIDFDHWPLSKEEQEFVKGLYPNSELIDPDEEDIEAGDDMGYVQFQVVGKLTYELVIEVQGAVTNQMRQIGGVCESWGVMQEGA